MKRRSTSRSWRTTLALLACGVFATTATAGVLRAHPENPLFFTQDGEKAIYLAGHQIFVDLQDNSFNKAVTRDREKKLNWANYLAFIEQRGINYLRNWIIWSTGSGTMAPRNQAIAAPMPYQRVRGKGKANDGLGKFDLERFDEAFFRRLYERCRDLERRSVFVSIMLFEVYGFLGGESCGDPSQTLWDGNVFNRANNINGIDTDDNQDGLGIEFFYTHDERVQQLQRAFVKKVVDTLNDLDNIFFEIANELHAPRWQYEMIEFIRDCERTKPKQHLILMSPGGRLATGKWRRLTKQQVVAAPADCFAVSGHWDAQSYRKKDPPVNAADKPGTFDMDHVAPGSNDVAYLWAAFTRGYHFNLYDKPYESPGAEDAQWERFRRNLGKVVEYAERIDLAQARPQPALASTGYCLADRGEAYVVFQPEKKALVVRGLLQGRAYDFEWFDTRANAVFDDGRFTASGDQRFFESERDDAVLVVVACD